MECSLLSSSVHGIFQARELEWVAIFFSVAGRFLTTEPLGKSQNSFLKYKHVLCDIWDIIILEKFIRNSSLTGHPVFTWELHQ